ncbi:hypothetical protein JCM8547_003678 [Rhodosporidiobolus lusitaniae]
MRRIGSAPAPAALETDFIDLDAYMEDGDEAGTDEDEEEEDTKMDVRKTTFSVPERQWAVEIPIPEFLPRTDIPFPDTHMARHNYRKTIREMHTLEVDGGKEGWVEPSGGVCKAGNKGCDDALDWTEDCYLARCTNSFKRGIFRMKPARGLCDCQGEVSERASNSITAAHVYTLLLNVGESGMGLPGSVIFETPYDLKSPDVQARMAALDETLTCPESDRKITLSGFTDKLVDSNFLLGDMSRDWRDYFIHTLLPSANSQTSSAVILVTDHLVRKAEVLGKETSDPLIEHLCVHGHDPNGFREIYTDKRPLQLVVLKEHARGSPLEFVIGGSQEQQAKELAKLFRASGGLCGVMGLPFEEWEESKGGTASGWGLGPHVDRTVRPVLVFASRATPATQHLCEESEDSPSFWERRRRFLS